MPWKPLGTWVIFNRKSSKIHEIISQKSLAGNEKIVLSEQLLVDCEPYGAGCDGGWVDAALDYLIRNGAETEADYPYTAGELEEGGKEFRNIGLA